MALTPEMNTCMHCRYCRGKTNFFEKRVGDYQKAGVMNGLSADAMHSLSFDDDF